MTTTSNTKPHDIIKKILSPWWYLLIGNGLGLLALWFYWREALNLPPDQFFITAALLSTTTALAAAPLIRFVILDWEARYQEFLNRLNNESLIAYLQQFWEKRTTQDENFIGWEQGDITTATRHEIDLSMERVFDTIYLEQHGRAAYIAPMILLNASIFILIILSTLIFLDQVKLPDYLDASVAIASVAGAYMYIVSDTVQSARQRSLNSSSIYWYTLRMLLAIPIGVALTYPVTLAVKPFVAFGLGAIPMDEIIKLLRRLTSKELSLSESAEKSDQLIQLEGVTVRIASMLVAEGVDSVEQIITVDPVLLSIRTGLPFKFILQLGAQAIVRRHLGDATRKLIPLGLADARSIKALVADLDNNNNINAQIRARATLTAAAELVMPTAENATISDYSTECLEFNLRQIANENYTHFISGKLLKLS